MPTLVVISGSVSTGNRLVAAYFARAGCKGWGSTGQPSDREVLAWLVSGSDAVVIRHYGDLGGTLQEAKKMGATVRVVVPVREPTALAASQKGNGHTGSPDANQSHLLAVLAEVHFRGLPFYLLPIEALVLHPLPVVRNLLDFAGLLHGDLSGTIEVNKRRVSPIPFNLNAKHFGEDSPDPRPEHGKELVWWPERGFGYYPARPEGVYDAAYFAKYEAYAKTEMGEKLRAARLALVQKHGAESVFDVGIGSGDFLRAASEAGLESWGYDVSPHGVEWLKRRGRFRNPYVHPAENLTLWDSLEHVADPSRLVRRASGLVFVSLPIFEGPDHVLRSKHFRPAEHYWYFTDRGFQRWATRLGFEMIETNEMETEIGREDIRTYVLRRKR